jgi:hypothetical protein
MTGGYFPGGVRQCCSLTWRGEQCTHGGVIEQMADSPDGSKVLIPLCGRHYKLAQTDRYAVLALAGTLKFAPKGRRTKSLPVIEDDEEAIE